MGKDTDGLLNEMFFVNYEDFAEIDFRENWKGRMYIISLFEMFRERIERRGRNCGRERNNGMWEEVEGRSEDIYGSKKYNRITRLWQTTGNGDEEPIIAGARVRTGEIINPKP